MVFCTYCGQSFTRDEHLERHILTHTNVKPFKCFTCHMSFARRDLLQRHYTVHGRDANNQEGLVSGDGMIPKSAGRTPIACSNCAKTKTKCDKKFPCSRCAGRNLTCTLRPTRRASKAAVSQAAAPVDSSGSGSPSETGLNNSTNDSSSSSPQPQRQPQAGLSTESQNKSPSPAEGRRSGDTNLKRLDSSPSSNQDAGLPSVIPPATTPTSGFAHHTPLMGYEEFIRLSEDLGHSTSPQFPMDWSTIQMPPFGFDGVGRSDLMMAVDMNLDLSDMSTGGEEILSSFPGLSQTMASIPTPITTPRMEGLLSDLELGRSAAMHHPHLGVPGGNSPGIPDLAAIIAAQDGWTVFRCTPPISPSSCPRTARPNLIKLEQSLRNHDCWSEWKPPHQESDSVAVHALAVVRLRESTRDKLLAITQTFLHKALEIHQEATTGSPSGSPSPRSSGSNFVLLPPAGVLEHFLCSYASTFEHFFPLTARGSLDTNDLMHYCDEKAASLLVLMMIAQGAMMIPSVETRSLTGGLTEACRISLFDLIEKNIVMSGDPIVLHAALLFTVQAAWSGDKWQMDIAMGQRGMYFAMLRHSGALGQSGTSTIGCRNSPEEMWRKWIQEESRSRLTYAWVMVDQDLALFHDTAPLFSVTEFGTPMPDSDQLWKARSAAEWSNVFEKVHEFSSGVSSVGSGARPMSLRDLFRQFLDDEIVSPGIELTPLHLRLLLHPLQTLVCQYSQFLSCFSEHAASRRKKRAVTAASTRGRLEEVQLLLQRWFSLAERYTCANAMCPTMQASLVQFHLISLNAVTNFPEIEKLARREGYDGSFQQLAWIHKLCILDVEEAIVHCGQIVRLVRSMDRRIRPPWWAGAIYRVALVLWMDSLTREESVPTRPDLRPVLGPSFAVDALPTDHPLIVRYLAKREGVPTLTKRDGSQTPLDNGFATLSHCIDVIDQGYATRFSDGIRNKLDRLARL